MSRDVIQILVPVHSLHTFTFTGRKSISIQLQNSGKLRRKRFISPRSVRLEIFSTIFYLDSMRSHWNWTRKVHKKTPKQCLVQGLETERERETRRRRQVWKDWRAEPTELSQAESSQVAALRCVELRYLSGSWTLTEQSGGRVRLHERWYAATRVASHVSDRYMCECVYVQRKYLIDDL